MACRPSVVSQTSASEVVLVMCCLIHRLTWIQHVSVVIARLRISKSVLWELNRRLWIQRCPSGPAPELNCCPEKSICPAGHICDPPVARGSRPLTLTQYYWGLN